MSDNTGWSSWSSNTLPSPGNKEIIINHNTFNLTTVNSTWQIVLLITLLSIRCNIYLFLLFISSYFYALLNLLASPIVRILINSRLSSFSKVLLGEKEETWKKFSKESDEAAIFFLLSLCGRPRKLVLKVSIKTGKVWLRVIAHMEAPGNRLPVLVTLFHSCQCQVIFSLPD